MVWEQEQRILSAAIKKWKPVALVSLFSGGYDSMITTHLLHSLNTHGLPIQVWSIDTKLSADGWPEYVQSVADRYGWKFQIYDNQTGYEEFVRWVERGGCPRTKSVHVQVYRMLKERAIAAIHMVNKSHRNDKVLFVAGTRRAESVDRRNVDEYHRLPKSNMCFAAPIVHWSNEQCDLYRVENDLPDNPFYDTVSGSGDCQCNWGNFITLRMLQKHSPNLAAGNVAELDAISRELHGYGWDGKLEGQTEMLEGWEDHTELTSPFLCQDCSRTKTRVPARTIEQRYLQLGIF